MPANHSQFSVIGDANGIGWWFSCRVQRAAGREVTPHAVTALPNSASPSSRTHGGETVMLSEWSHGRDATSLGPRRASISTRG
jgi:hypothetical protein